MVADSITDNVLQVRQQLVEAERISGRQPGAVTIVAATKYASVEQIAGLWRAGITDLGENRLTALSEHQTALATLAPDAQIRWHFIGRLQSREAAEVGARVATIQTLQSQSAVRRLAALPPAELPKLFVQVNVSGDPAKDGLSPDQLLPFLDELPQSLRIAGLMTMPAFVEQAEQSRPAFVALRELREHAVAAIGADRHPLTALSMGTTQDFLVAAQEGATHVRLGRVLYAERE